ncbi:MFS transporter [Trebonia kvetii]|uniref:MFS transporter n=1 Tax=Trebonia kvetii TaxID=2480626 RepID=A0A6P2C6K0_9ACTN|nr:MFS transporter [Trebonia kvetii]TVZ07059.1 MFS transporter [Trebonia kvetii]
MRNSGRRGAVGPARWAVSAHFLIMGWCSGVWLARVPAAKTQAHLSDGTLGIALFAVPVGLVLGAALAERLVDRAGSSVLVRVTGLASCVGTTLPGFAHNLPVLMAALFVIGVAVGTLDVSQNAQGVRVEAAYGRPVMTSMHAFYSLGAILGSLAGGGFALAGIGLLPSLAAAGITGLIVDATAGFWLLPETPEPPNEPRGTQGQLYWPDGTQGQNDSGLAAPRASSEALATVPSSTQVTPAVVDRRQVRRLVLALGVLGICGLICEGAAGDWSAVYLRDNLGTSAGLAAFGFAAFSVTMTVGRAVGDRLIHRFGVVTVIRTSGVIATAGIALALSTRVPAVTIAGFTAFGAGLSIVVPQVFAAGGRADPERPGSGLARVVGLGYTGMAAGPAIIGVVANQIGLHLALVVLVVLAAWIAVAASALGEPRNRSGKLISPIADQKAAGIP